MSLKCENEIWLPPSACAHIILFGIAGGGVKFNPAPLQKSFLEVIYMYIYYKPVECMN